MPTYEIQGIAIDTDTQNALSLSGPAIERLVPNGAPAILDLLDGAKTDSANFVELVSNAIINLQTGAISDWTQATYKPGVDSTVNFADIAPAIAAAQARGLNVFLAPHVGDYWGTGGARQNLWSTSLTISNPDAFFAGYKSYLLTFAQLAEQSHVSILSIGTEMAAATKAQFTPYWNDMISSVRQVFHGALTYGALGSFEASQVPFWDKLDYASVDVYPNLGIGSDANPSVAKLDSLWPAEVTRLNNFAKAVGKPIIFQETGLPSVTVADGGSGPPATGAIADFQKQTNWWQSFFDTWGQTKPAWLKGIFAWGNQPELGPNPVSAFSYWNVSFSLNNKPAEAVVSQFYNAAHTTTLSSGVTETINGLTTLDTVKFASAHTSYTISSIGDASVVVRSTAAVDTLISIERLAFSDEIIAFDLSGSAGQAYRMYQAAFARTPDKDGVSYWVSQVDKGMSLHDLGQSFIGSAEFKGIYGASPSVDKLVTGFYTNVLGRAPDSTGLSYWVGQVQSGLSTPDLLVSFSESGENKAHVAAAIQNGIELSLSYFG